MLSLPHDWEQCTTGHLATTILKRITRHDRTLCATSLVTAALDLLIEGRREWSPSYPDYEHISGAAWRINDWTLRYHSRITDSTLARYRRLLDDSPSPFATALVPRGQREVLRAALRTYTETPPDVMELQGYLDIRVLLTAMDMGWTIDRTQLRLLQRYNNHIQKESPTLMVQLPLRAQSEQ